MRALVPPPTPWHEHTGAMGTDLLPLEPRLPLGSWWSWWSLRRKHTARPWHTSSPLSSRAGDVLPGRLLSPLPPTFLHPTLHKALAPLAGTQPQPRALAEGCPDVGRVWGVPATYLLAIQPADTGVPQISQGTLPGGTGM